MVVVVLLLLLFLLFLLLLLLFLLLLFLLLLLLLLLLLFLPLLFLLLRVVPGFMTTRASWVVLLVDACLRALSVRECEVRTYSSRLLGGRIVGGGERRLCASVRGWVGECVCGGSVAAMRACVRACQQQQQQQQQQQRGFCAGVPLVCGFRLSVFRCLPTVGVLFHACRCCRPWPLWTTRCSSPCSSSTCPSPRR